MKSKSACIGAMVTVLVLLAPVYADGDDWPQWRGPNRDGSTEGFDAPGKWPSALTSLWSVQVGLGAAPPVLSGDRVYAFARQGDDEVVLCLDASTGNEIWRDRYPSVQVKGAARGFPGPRSSPAVSGDKLVTYGVGGVLSCYNRMTGSLLWRKDEGEGEFPSFYTSMSPLITSGLCIAHVGGKKNGAVVAYDLESGNEKWRSTGHGPAYASPTPATIDGVAQIVVETVKTVLAVALDDGRLLWEVPFPQSMRSPNCSTPVVIGSDVIVSASGRGTTAYTLAKDGTAFAANEKWFNDDVNMIFNTPVSRDGFLYGLSDKGRLFCMDAGTGEVMWTDDSRHQRFGSITGVGSAIIALPSASPLIVFEADPGGYKELARYTVSEGTIYAHPIFSGNRVFIKDEERLTAWSVE